MLSSRSGRRRNRQTRHLLASRFGRIATFAILSSTMTGISTKVAQCRITGVATAFVKNAKSSTRHNTIALHLRRSQAPRAQLLRHTTTARQFSSDSKRSLSSVKTSTALSSSSADDSPASSILGSVKEQYCRSRLLFLKDEMIQLANDKEFNANSPSQRSMALFGEVRSCTKGTIQAIADGTTSGMSNDQKLLAQYILEFQELSKLTEPAANAPGKQETIKAKDTKLGSQLNPKTLSTTRTEPTIKDSVLGADETPTKQKASSEAHKPAPEHARKDTIFESLMEPKEPKSSKKKRETSSKSEISVTSPPAVRTRAKTTSSRRPPRKRPITYEEIVEKLFAKPKRSKLDVYWKEPLLELSRPVARDLAKQLDPELCPMGYNPDYGQQKAKAAVTRGKRVGFLGYCRDQKELYPNHVVLVRCGDFYETFGVDALLLVEHVGLNPMGGKARSGCPKQNIQPTLDGLTSQGFSVAVYEELEPIGTSSSKKLKTRSLAQIVSPASPTYLYDNWLLGDASNNNNNGEGMNDASYSLDGLPPPRPCVGVVHTAAGYNIVEVSLEERSIQYSERLTAEAVACRLAAYPPADPLVYVPLQSEYEATTPLRPSFLPNSKAKNGEGGQHRLRTKILSPHLVPDPVPGKSDADRYIHSIVEMVLQMNELQTKKTSEEEITEKESKPVASMNDFTVTMASTSTNPLYVETATQIGLMKDKTIPSLIRHVLDDAAPAATRRFLHRYMLIPPPPSVAQSMAQVVGTLIDETNTISLPPLTVPNLGKSLILIRAGQAGAGVYGELLQSLDTTMYVLESFDDEKDETMEAFVEALLHICQHESGLPAKRDSLLDRCRDAVSSIEAVVSSSYHVEEDFESLEIAMKDQVSRDDYIPVEFFERNEKSWRGRVQQSVATDAYERVRAAAEELSQAIQEDFIGTHENNKALIKYNFFDNLISMNKIPSEGFENEMEFLHPNDRFGKVLSNRWTTEKVKRAVSNYVSECENATNEVASILSALAQDLQDNGHIPAIVQSSHFNLILSTAFHHAVKATNAQWQLANTIEDTNDDDDILSGAHFVDVFPYWMHKSKAVTNTFDLSSMILLTAPNMSGKSTLMRSTAAAALLTVCGLCAPLSSSSTIPRFDTLFLRGASADVPTEDKSAFGAEMGDLAALFRCSGHKSLVFVDELGRGTSPRDGTRLAGAVLETMAESGMSGIFATHLHDILDLPLNKTRIVTKRIKIDRSEGKDGATNYEWTHKLEDGMCKDSMALVTAERFGLPDEIISRARELTTFIPERSSTQDFTSKQTETIYTRLNESELEPTTFPQNTKNNTVLEDDGEAKDDDDDELDEKVTKMKVAKLKEGFETEFNNVIDLASGLFSVDASDSDSEDSDFSDDEESNTSKTIVGAIEVPPRHHPPASLSNRSCLYVLQLVPQGLSTMDNATAKYYVGETDSISKRLKQHRKKGGAWKASRAVVFPLGNKSMARYCESALIGAMAREGYSMESLEDGRTLRHFRD